MDDFAGRCHAALPFPRVYIRCAREEGHRGPHEAETDGLKAAWSVKRPHRFVGLQRNDGEEDA